MASQRSDAVPTMRHAVMPPRLSHRTRDQGIFVNDALFLYDSYYIVKYNFFRRRFRCMPRRYS
jgi:hypothetical protein